jgi:hypothetical protein
VKLNVHSSTIITASENYEVTDDNSSLWRSSKRPTAEDYEATLALLNLRNEYDDQLNNKSKV